MGGRPVLLKNYGDMKKDNYTDDEVEQLIVEADKRSYSGRLERLRILLSTQTQDTFPAPALALEYYEEARLCWYVGAFVATIIMTQLAFEELLRSHYRVVKGVGGNLDCGKKVDEAGFFDLINEARNEGWLLRNEAESLHALRKNLRNPYVHVKDIKVDSSGKIEIERPCFLMQNLKIVAPELIGSGAEDEAREAIRLLVNLFPEMSSHSGGF